MDKHWDVHIYPSGDGLTIFARDATEERRATAALRTSEERMRLAIDAARLGIRDMDLVNRTTVWTAGAERIFGGDYVRRMTFKALLAAVHPEEQALLQSTWRHALSAPGNDYEIEYRVRHPDGHWHWVCAYGRVMFEAGRPVRAVAVLQDISTRKKTEADLQQATALLRAISSSSADAIYAKVPRAATST